MSTIINGMGIKMKEKVKKLLAAEPVLPGTLEKHYNVCGKPGCRCKDKINPRKHGPYYRLSYNVKGKNSSVFVKKEDAEAIKKMTENYKKARSNTQDMALVMVDFYRKNGLDATLNEYRSLLERERTRQAGGKSASAVLKETRNSRDKWKKKAIGRVAVINKNRVTIRDIRKSCDSWKKKAMASRKKVIILEKKLEKTEKLLRKAEKEQKLKKKLPLKRN